MFITSENITLHYNKSNGNDDIASVIAKDFLSNVSNNHWEVLECSHETKGNFDLVLSDGKKFECFEFKSGMTIDGELIFNENQVKKSNKVYGIIFKKDEYIDSIVFCQFDISAAVKLGIFNENNGKKGLRYRYKLSISRYNSLMIDYELTSPITENLKVKVLEIYKRDRIARIIKETNDFRKGLKKLFV